MVGAVHQPNRGDDLPETIPIEALEDALRSARRRADLAEEDYYATGEDWSTSSISISR